MDKCSVENCEKPKRCKGYCVNHYALFNRYGDPLIKKGRWDGYIKKQKPCSNKNCSNMIWKCKYCSKCRLRKSRHGDVNTVLSRKKLKYNDNFLEKDNAYSHYFIGWIASDGYINEKQYVVNLEICDLPILERFKELINYSGKIKTYPKRKEHHKQAYKLSICSKKMVQDFVKIGVRQKKSKTIEMPKINQEHFYHFLRGLIEGDGSIVYQKYYDKRRDKIYDRLFVFLNSASKKLLDQISEIVDIKPTSIVLKTYEQYDNAYRLVWTDKKALALCELLYKDSENLRLGRKYQKYIEYKSIKENNANYKSYCYKIL